MLSEGTFHESPKFLNLRTFNVRLGKQTREHSGSDTKHWQGPAQRCSLQGRKPDRSDCQCAQRFRALEPRRGVSALQSSLQLEGVNHFISQGVFRSATVDTSLPFFAFRHSAQ